MSSVPPTNAPSSPPSAAVERRPTRWWFACCVVPLFGAATVFLSLVFAVLLHWPVSNRTCARWEQPNTVNYQSNDPYVLSVKDNSSWWNIFHRYRHCRIEVTSHQTVDLYGHMIEHEFCNSFSDPDYFTQCTVTWESEGVTITEPTGHKLFIPKKAFISGR